MKELGRKLGSVCRTGPAHKGWRNWIRGSIPTLGQLSESDEKHLKLRLKQLICGSLNGRRITSPRRNHTYPRQGCRSPVRCSSWELQFRDCGAIPGQGLPLTAEIQIEGMWGRRLWWEMPVEENQAAIEARRYCRVTQSRWSQQHSLSPPTR